MSEIDGQNGKKEEVLDGLVLLLGIFRSFGTRCISTPSFVVNLAPSSPLPSRASASSFKALCAIIVCANQHILSNIYRLEWQGGGGRDRDKLLLPRESNGIWQRKKKPSNITKFPTWFPNDRVRRPQKSFVEYFLFCKKKTFSRRRLSISPLLSFSFLPFFALHKRGGGRGKCQQWLSQPRPFLSIPASLQRNFPVIHFPFSVHARNK